ncbi:MAG: 4Fe-4S dicluster domain-containing protein [Myxococcota bacterium]
MKDLDRSKVERAEAHPDRPGEHCFTEPGNYGPFVHLARCLGHGDCTRVCPEGVFELRPLRDIDYRRLSVLERIRRLPNGRRAAYTPNHDKCMACGLCEVICPEDAITLIDLRTGHPAAS